jgi:hypothetical protein
MPEITPSDAYLTATSATPFFIVFVFSQETGTKNAVPVCEAALKLLSEAELLDNSSVSLDILLSEVRKKLLSVTNHLGESSLRVEILGVLLHVLGKTVDSIGKDSNLHFRRTGIILVDFELGDDGGFGFLRNHCSSPFLKITPKSE